MLNIRKDKLEKVAVFALYGLLLGGLPHTLANANDVEGSTVTVQAKTVDPLDKYKGAKDLSDTRGEESCVERVT